MARYIGPKFKVSRQLGENVFNHPKALKRGIKNHGKLSEYGEQLLEKQKLKMYYGVLEKQFNRYVNEAVKSKGNSGEILVQNLERRLDNIVYRLGFSGTLRQARQMVVHGHVLVNGKKVDRPSFRVGIGNIVTLTGRSDYIRTCNNSFKETELSQDYLNKDIESLTGKLIKIPNRNEIPVNVKDSKILEFYSRN